MTPLETGLTAARSLLDTRTFNLSLEPPNGAPVCVRMTSSRYVVGRGQDCDLQLPDPNRLLSRRHLMLERRAAGLRVTDMSRNGCAVDGVPMLGGSSLLRPGQRLAFGGFTLIAELPAGETETRTTLSGSLHCPLDLGMIGNSPALVGLRDEIFRTAAYHLPVLIQGETGTGKELVARALHDASAHAAGPFVALNCGAISEGTAGSELFGHEKGAFTGASSSRKGAFRSAEGGTLFLDEIGELPPSLQATLLRTLETREVLPLGAEKSVPVHFRVVTATHRNLEREVRAGRFREDLYYRVNVIALELPALRDRPSDVLDLALHFAHEAAGCRVTDFSQDAVDALSSCYWPGNVRQLRNVVVRALVDSGGGQIGLRNLDLRGADTPPVDSRDGGIRWSEQFVPGGGQEVGAPVPGSFETGPEFPSIPPARVAPGDGLSQIVAALRRSGGNRSSAARALGISRSTLYARLSRYSAACAQSLEPLQCCEE